jgi:hypothetical protein
MNPYCDPLAYAQFLALCGCHCPQAGRSASFGGELPGGVVQGAYEALGANIEALRVKMASAGATGALPASTVNEFNLWAAGWGPFFVANYPPDAAAMVDDYEMDKLAPWQSQYNSWQTVYEQRGLPSTPSPPKPPPKPAAPWTPSPVKPPTVDPVKPAVAAAAGGGAVLLMLGGAALIAVLMSRAR